MEKNKYICKMNNDNYRYFGLNYGSSCEDFLKKTTFFVEGEKYTV